MAKNKFDLNFDGFLELAATLDGLGEAALKRATESALKATDAYVTREVEKAVAASKFDFNRTGTTKRSIDRDITVNWEGTRAEAKAGFTISNGGMPSIYLTHGTPHIKPDTKLKAATKGTGKHKKAIQALQADAFNKVLRRVIKNG